MNNYGNIKPISASASVPLSQELAQPMTVKHHYRNIKIAENTTITIDVEDLKKKMVDDFYKQLGCGINYGA